MSLHTHTASDLTYGVPDVLRQIKATTSIDDALEHAVAPDRPRRTTREWLDELGEALAWTADDLDILDGVHGGLSEDERRRLAADLAIPDDGPPTVAELRTLVRWRAQASLIQLAAHAARAAATLADEDALESVAPGPQAPKTEQSKDAGSVAAGRP
jgi:hypothetical protein